MKPLFLALAISLSACSASQNAAADLAFEREQAVEACAAAVERKYELLSHPEKLTVTQALAATTEIRACVKPTDAGA